jgi:uncharacterized protein (DUF433 family)
MRANIAVAERTGTAVALSPRLLSLREAVVLAGVDEKEKEIRNDLHRGVLPDVRVIRFDNSHMCFHLAYVPTFAVIYGNHWLDGRELRRAVFKKVFAVFDAAPTSCLEVIDHAFTMMSECARASRIDVDNYIAVDVGKACEDVTPRVNTYVRGLARVEEKDSVLGGAAVFRDTRISVAHIGGLAERGESIENILEDYPKLTEADVEFAKLYYRARPPVGRPRRSGGAKDEHSRK